MRGGDRRQESGVRNHTSGVMEYGSNGVVWYAKEQEPWISEAQDLE
jgi:hypothetical protein